MGKNARADKERERFIKMSFHEDELSSAGFSFIAGVDEAGRGPLAGPVVAAAVILKNGVYIEGVNDSKQLTPLKRDCLYDIIVNNCISYGIGMVDEKMIDGINILNATKLAMINAISILNPGADYILTDAVRLEKLRCPQKNIIKGDSLSVSIAAASIIAKVTRDRFIEDMDDKYPQYGFKKHKGYGTSEHIEAIKKFGICPIHRISFTKKFVL